MNRVALSGAAISLCLGAYWAGSLSTGETDPATPAQSDDSSPMPGLPDPQRMAGMAAEQLESLPPGVWQSPASPEQPLPDETGQLAAEAEPMPTNGRQTEMAVPSRPMPPGEGVGEASKVKAAIGRSLAAIVRSNGTYRLVLADPDTTVRRTLIVGDTYGDGWRVQRIGSDGVTLARAAERLQVPATHVPMPRRVLNSVPPTEPRLAGYQQPDYDQTAQLRLAPPGNQAPRRQLSRRAAALNQE